MSESPIIIPPINEKDHLRAILLALITFNKIFNIRLNIQYSDTEYTKSFTYTTEDTDDAAYTAAVAALNAAAKESVAYFAAKSAFSAAAAANKAKMNATKEDIVEENFANSRNIAAKSAEYAESATKYAYSTKYTTDAESTVESATKSAVKYAADSASTKYTTDVESAAYFGCKNKYLKETVENLLKAYYLLNLLDTPENI